MKSTQYKTNRKAVTNFASTIPPVPIVNINDASSLSWDNDMSEEERNAFYLNEDRSLGEELFQRGLRSSEFSYTLNGIL